VEGSGCGILFDTIPAFVWRGWENPCKIQSRLAVETFPTAKHHWYQVDRHVRFKNRYKNYVIDVSIMPCIYIGNNFHLKRQNLSVARIRT
jgi:hypothetical protein